MTELGTQGYSMQAICNYVGISRQAYHQRKQMEAARQEVISKAELDVIKARQKRSRVGLRTIYHMSGLKELLGINKYESAMSSLGYALKPVKNYRKTTDSRGHHNKFPNLISGLKLQSENEVIVGDITYYDNRGQRYYIFQFRDYYTLEIKGLLGAKTMEGIHAERCLRQVFAYNNQRKYNHELILHTDAGGQYRSNRFIEMLNRAQIRPSHAGNCFENGLAEQTNGLVKNEYLVDYDIKSVSQLNKVLNGIQYQVNETYPSRSLGYLMPKEFSAKVRQKKKADRPVKIIKEVEKI